VNTTTEPVRLAITVPIIISKLESYKLIITSVFFTISWIQKSCAFSGIDFVKSHTLFYTLYTQFFKLLYVLPQTAQPTVIV